MRRIWILVTISILSAGAAWAQQKETNRLKECGTVIKEMLGVPDAIPQDLLDKAECAVVFPSVKKFAFGIGGSYGRGAMVCRSGNNYTGSWGAPAMHWRAAISDFSSVGRQPISCCW
jgi:SH3 domain-containing YSC84-like protein 1